MELAMVTDRPKSFGQQATAIAQDCRFGADGTVYISLLNVWRDELNNISVKSKLIEGRRIINITDGTLITESAGKTITLDIPGDFIIVLRCI